MSWKIIALVIGFIPWLTKAHVIVYDFDDSIIDHPKCSEFLSTNTPLSIWGLQPPLPDSPRLDELVNRPIIASGGTLEVDAVRRNATVLFLGTRKDILPKDALLSIEEEAPELTSPKRLRAWALNGSRLKNEIVEQMERRTRTENKWTIVNLEVVVQLANQQVVRSMPQRVWMPYVVEYEVAVRVPKMIERPVDRPTLILAYFSHYYAQAANWGRILQASYQLLQVGGTLRIVHRLALPEGGTVPNLSEFENALRGNTAFWEGRQTLLRRALGADAQFDLGGVLATIHPTELAFTLVIRKNAEHTAPTVSELPDPSLRLEDLLPKKEGKLPFDILDWTTWF